MYRIHIIEYMGKLTANIIITGDEDDFRNDLKFLKSTIAVDDRQFVDSVEPKYWRVRNVEKYLPDFPDLAMAVRIHKAQLHLKGFE